MEAPPEVGVAFGVRRTDTNAVLAAAGAATVHVSTGVYTYTLTDPGPGVPYEAWFKATVGSDTIYKQLLKTSSGAADSDPLSYLTVTEAKALLGSLPGFPKLNAASDPVKLAAA